MQNNRVFGRIVIVQLASTGFHERPLFVQRPGGMVRFPHFEENLLPAVLSDQVEERAQQTRAQAEAASRPVNGDILNLPLVVDLPRDDESLHRSIVLDNQRCPALCSRRSEEILVFSGAPLRGCSGVRRDLL